MVVTTEERREHREHQLAQIDDDYDLPGKSEHVPFTGVNYVAMLEPRMVRFNRAGDMVVGFTIPARYVDSVVQLRAAMRTPVLLRIEPWKPNGTER